MSNIDLQAGKIDLEGQWLSVEDLASRIQEKMNAGDMKISNLATVLEELNTALENSHTIEAKIVIPTVDYEKLKSLGGEDDIMCVHKAILAFIGGSVPKKAGSRTSESADDAEEKKKKLIKCAKCKAAIEIPAGEKPTEIECPECGTVGRLKPQNKNNAKHQDHILE